MARSDRRHPVTCESCGSETTVDAEAKRLGGYCECPICGADINLDAAVEDDNGGEV
jgi:transcription elongation factor Elf1